MPKWWCEDLRQVMQAWARVTGGYVVIGGREGAQPDDVDPRALPLPVRFLARSHEDPSGGTYAYGETDVHRDSVRNVDVTLGRALAVWAIGSRRPGWPCEFDEPEEP